MQPLFTIITPSFNTEAFIAKCIASVAEQSFTNYEHLVLDGGSKDGTLDILKEKSEQHPQLRWISEKDKGIYDAMNKGIRMAKGQWLFFLGADDSFYDNEVLANISKLIASNSEAEMVYGNVQLNKPIGYASTELVYAGEFDGDKLLDKNICHQSIFYNKNIFQKFGDFNTRYKIFADWDFNLLCFNRIRSVYYPGIVAHFFVGGSSVQVKDAYFEKEWTLNMATRYPYPPQHPFFFGKRKELLSLMLQEITAGRVANAACIGKVLAAQIVHTKTSKAKPFKTAHHHV